MNWNHKIYIPSIDVRLLYNPYTQASLIQLYQIMPVYLFDRYIKVNLHNSPIIK